ncbi:hypothetical protein [Streptomyces sp. NPDC092129]|uniref:hypothetical protein n=1 Tax=Streptomyces sp. NPDC092129 TaxID=3366010 RepID=UPI0038042909
MGQKVCAARARPPRPRDKQAKEFSKPVVIKANGSAYGARCEISQAAPAAMAAEQGPSWKPGFAVPFGGSSRPLTRRARRKRVLETILIGEPIPVTRAAPRTSWTGRCDLPDRPAARSAVDAPVTNRRRLR